ncbi:MAG TPA: M24 family metallopeptidase [Gemmatimonadales bacterium]|nr:M24 family metallopeptidase [Gemmatimonadales bacterium]
MSGISAIDRAQLAEGLAELGADGWLLFDFHGLNPVAGRVLALGGLGSRRLFVLIPRTGAPTAVAHKIELQPMEGFPGTIVPYARWEELHAALGPLVKGKTLAMEVSPRDAVPYLDRIPHGVIQLLEGLGAKIVSSDQLVTRFAARWSAAELADHLAAAEVLADVAKEQLAWAVTQGGKGLTESALQRRTVAAMEARGLRLTTHPIVGFGPNAANPHYEPHEGQDRTLAPDEVVLLDLWGGRGRVDTVFADQTWMGFSGRRVPSKVQQVWEVVRDARDAAVALVQERVAAGKPLAGYEVDRAARGVIERAGFGASFVHRTGHSIDRDLHGSGPHMDDFETHDERRLIPGVGFSVEPGVYLVGEFGIRSEVNMFWGESGARVTPTAPQRDLILPGA